MSKVYLFVDSPMPFHQQSTGDATFLSFRSFCQNNEFLERANLNRFFNRKKLTKTRILSVYVALSARK